MLFLKFLIIGLVIASGIYFSFFKKSPTKENIYTLEEQVEILNELGIPLNDNVTIDDLLNSFDRDAYEDKPFDLILFTYGVEIESEPWGRKFSNKAWNFDLECIEDNGSYIDIVRNFALISNNLKNIENIQDFVDFEKEEAWVSYSINGIDKRYDAVFDNDWADPISVTSIMSDLTNEGFAFYAKDNGQASVWYYLDDKTAKKLNEYSKNALVKN
jgi:hypothetical protein